VTATLLLRLTEVFVDVHSWGKIQQALPQVNVKICWNRQENLQLRVFVKLDNVFNGWGQSLLNLPPMNEHQQKLLETLTLVRKHHDFCTKLIIKLMILELHGLVFAVLEGF